MLVYLTVAAACWTHQVGAPSAMPSTTATAVNGSSSNGGEWPPSRRASNTGRSNLKDVSRVLGTDCPQRSSSLGDDRDTATATPTIPPSLTSTAHPHHSAGSDSDDVPPADSGHAQEHLPSTCPVLALSTMSVTESSPRPVPKMPLSHSRRASGTASIAIATARASADATCLPGSVLPSPNAVATVASAPMDVAAASESGPSQAPIAAVLTHEPAASSTEDAATAPRRDKANLTLALDAASSAPAPPQTPATAGGESARSRLSARGYVGRRRSKFEVALEPQLLDRLIENADGVLELDSDGSSPCSGDGSSDGGSSSDGVGDNNPPPMSSGATALPDAVHDVETFVDSAVALTKDGSFVVKSG